MKTWGVMLLALFACLISACGKSEAAKVFQVQPNPELSAQLKTALPKLLNACPGLNTYAADFSQATLSRPELIDMQDGIELTFMVVDKPQTLPSPLNVRSAGNRCYIDINAEATQAYIGKRACHSLCDGKWHNNDPDSLGRTLLLK